jgi:hypothetical protein
MSACAVLCFGSVYGSRGSRPAAPGGGPDAADAKVVSTREVVAFLTVLVLVKPGVLDLLRDPQAHECLGEDQGDDGDDGAPGDGDGDALELNPDLAGKKITRNNRENLIFNFYSNLI